MRSLFSRKSDSTEENSSPSGNSKSQNDLEITPSVSSDNLTSPPVSKKRNHSSTNSDDDPKRQNINDSFLIQLDNIASDPETSPILNTGNTFDTPLVDSAIPNQEIQTDLSTLVPFDKNTPFWVPILLRSFDSLRTEINSTVLELSEEVKSLNSRFENFENVTTDILNRVQILENKSDASNKIIASFEKSLNATTQKVVTIDKELVDLKRKNVELEKGMDFVSGLSDELNGMKKEVGSLNLVNKKLNKTVDSLLNQIDCNEQHNRNECLLLHGVPEGNSETPDQSADLFCKSITQNMGIDISVECIRRAHRLGQRKNTGKPRPIIARFWESKHRNGLYYKKKLCKGKSISITENLTKRRVTLKNETEKKFGPKNVWTKEGKIYAKDDAGNIKLILA